jgi:protein-tyrosine kinase
MSRITEALTRARAAEVPVKDSADTVVPWDFGASRTAEIQVPWDFTAGTSAERSSSKKRTGTPGSTRKTPPEAAARPIAPGQAYAEKLIDGADLPPGLVEQYRRLGAALHQAQAEQGVRVLMVTSAMPAEGKTLVSSNLALVLSRSYGRRVLLIDADLRRPSLHTVFGVSNASGIADRIGGRQSGPLPTVTVSPTLDLLLAGAPQADPMRIVTSPEMSQLIAESAARYDFVLLDTPPVALLPDAHLLSAMVDRVLFVIEAGRTPFDLIQKSVTTVGKERVIGTVLNRAISSRTFSYYGSDDLDYGIRP